MQIKLGEKPTGMISRINKINGWQNRAVYGATALFSQPFFDYTNPDVDKTTRKYSLTKTMIKIVVGTGVGVVSRAAFQKWGEHLFKKGMFNLKNAGKITDMPRFKNCVGNTFAVLGAVVAMFSIDILVSNALLSFFNKRIAKGKSKK